MGTGVSYILALQPWEHLVLGFSQYQPRPHPLDWAVEVGREGRDRVGQGRRPPRGGLLCAQAASAQVACSRASLPRTGVGGCPLPVSHSAGSRRGAGAVPVLAPCGGWQACRSLLGPVFQQMPHSLRDMEPSAPPAKRNPPGAGRAPLPGSKANCVCACVFVCAHRDRNNLR